MVNAGLIHALDQLFSSREPGFRVLIKRVEPLIAQEPACPVPPDVLWKDVDMGVYNAYRLP
jgi:hypothetical protein